MESVREGGVWGRDEHLSAGAAAHATYIAIDRVCFKHLVRDALFGALKRIPTGGHGSVIVEIALL